MSCRTVKRREVESFKDYGNCKLKKGVLKEEDFTDVKPKEIKAKVKT